MSVEANKQVVARFVEVCQNQHDLAAADGMFHPQFVNHYSPGGRHNPITTSFIARKKKSIHQQDLSPMPGKMIGSGGSSWSGADDEHIVRMLFRGSRINGGLQNRLVCQSKIVH
jgi:hypothetical protein